ncbi:MAG: hypothetical protein ABSA62_12635 [Methyloceanibacter sp.]|jgi:hypothetical protein
MMGDTLEPADLDWLTSEDFELLDKAFVMLEAQIHIGLVMAEDFPGGLEALEKLIDRFRDSAGIALRPQLTGQATPEFG